MANVQHLVKVISLTPKDIMWVRFVGGGYGYYDLAGFDDADLRTVLPGVILTIEIAPNNEVMNFTVTDVDYWHEDPYVAVIRLIGDDFTLVEVDGRPKKIAQSALSIEVGNTVEATDSKGPLRILGPEPVTMLIRSEDKVDVSRFRRTNSRPLTFEQYGGNTAVVARARELIEVSLEKHEKLRSIGTKAIKGVLFTGEPGSGKTMLARIIASQASAQFYEVSGPEIFSKWYGESELVLRQLFDDARANGPSIIFFDELDSVASQRDDSAHEASKRVVTQLLTSMDRFDDDDRVVVIAATNRPQDLDEALRRPGRFDWQIDFPAPLTSDRLDILQKSAAPLQTAGPLPLGLIARLSHDWSAAQLVSVFTEAAIFAVLDDRDVLLPEDVMAGYERVVNQRTLVAATRTRRQVR